MELEIGDLVTNFHGTFLVLEPAKLRKTHSKKSRQNGVLWVSNTQVKCMLMGKTFATTTKITIRKWTRVIRDGELLEIPE